MDAGEALPGAPARAEQAARELDCLLTIGAIVGVMAHEINNPLAGIQNAFLLIKDAVPPDHPHYAYVAAIDREIRRIAAVTRRMADMFNPERDQALGVAVSTIVDEAARMSAAAGSAARASIRIAGGSEREPLAAPAGLLRHSLHQILAAAGRTADPEHPIHVGLRTDGGDVCVDIRHRATGSPDDLVGTAHSTRMLAALGAVSTVGHSDDGWREIVVRIPMTTLSAEQSNR